MNRLCRVVGKQIKRIATQLALMRHLNSKGLLAAVVTPMDGSGELNLEIVPRIVDHLESSGITGIYIAGTTGGGDVTY